MDGFGTPFASRLTATPGVASGSSVSFADGIAGAGFAGLNEAKVSVKAEVQLDELQVTGGTALLPFRALKRQMRPVSI